MGVNTYSVEIGHLSKYDTLRLWVPLDLPKLKYRYEKINKYIAFCQSGSRPKGGIGNDYIGEAISLGGEQIKSDGTVDTRKLPYVSDEFYAEAKKGKVVDGDILICKDGALTGKTCLVDFSVFPVKNVMVNEHVYILRANEDKILQKFLFYFTQTEVFQAQVRDLAFRKKAQPGLNSDHFKRIRIPDVSPEAQKAILSKIEPIESKIQQLSREVKPSQHFIDEVMAAEFGFNLEEINEIRKNKYFEVATGLTYRNFDVRNSARWNKIAPIQDTIYRDNPSINRLGKYLWGTKNGWSPVCSPADTDYFVYGVNNITSGGTIDFDDLKTSSQQKKDIEKYYSKVGDLYVSRGNTTDLVALASVVKEIPDDMNIVFPDLFIKVDVDDEKLKKEYLAYVFNSVIGRSYFKYASKGKNQTMVKISSDELNNFYLPVPEPVVQERIVGEIDAKLSEQKNLSDQIKEHFDSIKGILLEAIA